MTKERATETVLEIYSGKCKSATCGILTKIKDIHGNECHTGDIVILWSRDSWSDPMFGFPFCHGLTAIVEDKYTTYSNGEIVIDKDGEPFAMGIKDVCLNDPETVWAVEIVKKYKHVIHGENWHDFGFNYKEKTLAPPTEKLLEEFIGGGGDV